MELIPGQPCPYCGPGSMIGHAPGIGSWCDQGFNCKQPSPFKDEETPEDEIARLRRNLHSRDEFIVKCGLWQDFVDQLEDQP